MKHSESLKKNRDFQNVYKNGKSYANKYLVGNSVIRHHITRLIRESYRLQEDVFNSGLDIVIIARVAAKNKNQKDIESALLHLGGLHNIVTH